MQEIIYEGWAIIADNSYTNQAVWHLNALVEESFFKE